MSLSQSNPVSQKHHNEFDPSLTTTTKQHMVFSAFTTHSNPPFLLIVFPPSPQRDFVSKVLTGDLNEVPGIGPMNIQHFLECGGEKGEPIANTYQLIGKFLMMRDTNKDSKARAISPSIFSFSPAHITLLVVRSGQRVGIFPLAQVQGRDVARAGHHPRGVPQGRDVVPGPVLGGGLRPEVRRQRPLRGVHRRPHVA
jgi:hypothetical protein